MGTNYYTKPKTCEACKHTPQPVHLGKSSYGWQFTFAYNGGIYYKNIEEMEVWLRDKIIIDEYDKEVTQADFWKMVHEKQTPTNLNHTKYVRERCESRDSDYLIGGYSFIDTDFS